MSRRALVLKLLFSFGIVLLINPYAPGIHFAEVHGGEESVYRYEAATVTYNESTIDKGLQMTEPETGRELSLRSVDDEIICDGFANERLCQFEYNVYDGTNVSGMGDTSSYQFVYLSGALYRPTTVERQGGPQMSLNRVTDTDPLRHVADSGPLSGGARKAISSGSVMTYERLPEENTLVRHDGQYYTFYTTGFTEFSGSWSSGSSCSSSGEGFCSAAVSKRWTDALLTLCSWAIGAALVVVSAFRLSDLD
jgi:hypothetical protein